MPSNELAVYPGSFDPITNGHVDLVRRTLRVFDKVVIAIATNPDKDHSLFTMAERLEMIEGHHFTPYAGDACAHAAAVSRDFFRTALLG